MFLMFQIELNYARTSSQCHQCRCRITQRRRRSQERVWRRSGPPAEGGRRWRGQGGDRHEGGGYQQWRYVEVLHRWLTWYQGTDQRTTPSLVILHLFITSYHLFSRLVQSQSWSCPCSSSPACSCSTSGENTTEHRDYHSNTILLICICILILKQIVLYCKILSILL